MSKIGFNSVLALVIGSQIGSGIFMSPTSLGPLGVAAFWGWGIAGVGAVLLALVFAQLTMKGGSHGGPAGFVEQAFGRHAAFFVAWTYWVISWVSTPAVLIAAVGYLSPLIGLSDPLALLGWQIVLLALITALNLRGVQTAGRAEFFLSLLKVIPLIIIPLFALQHFDGMHLATLEPGAMGAALPQAVALTFWGFIGVETATTTAGSVDNPQKTIPRAVVLGTTLVAILYMANSLGIMGLLPAYHLSASAAPYADAAGLLFGPGWDLVLAAVASLVCVGTLNAWVLISGQIAQGAAEGGLFPPIFGRVNKRGAPVFSLLVSAVGIVPMLLLTLNPSMASQLNWVIDLSVTAFLIVYLVCVLAYFRLFSQQEGGMRLAQRLLGLLALLFCVGVLLFTSIEMVGLSLLFVVSAIPVYLWRRKQGALEGRITSDAVVSSLDSAP